MISHRNKAEDIPTRLQSLFFYKQFIQDHTSAYNANRLTRIAWITGISILVLLISLALFPDAIAPYSPTERVGSPLERPSKAHILGTNDIGQDILSELIWGTRISLSTGILVGGLSIIIGVVIGLTSGVTTGIIGSILMRLADLTLILPFLPLIILLSAYIGASQLNIILILSLVMWPSTARLIRARVLMLMGEPFIEAAQAQGSSMWDITKEHLWPGVRGLAGVQFVMVASASILAEASLSFLGFGNPSAKSWGFMLFFARVSGASLGQAWRWWVFPTGMMITLSVISFVLIGFALEHTLVPRLRRSR